MKFTISEIKNFIKEKNLKPSDIFSQEDLMKNPVIKKYIEEEKKKTLTNIHQKRKKFEKKHDKLREKMREDLKRLIKEKEDLIVELKK